MDMTEPNTVLAVIRPREISTIIAADQDDILGKLAAKVAAFKPDASTPLGRDEMRSLAYEIAKGKSALIKIGKGLTENWRKSTKAVNEECNLIETRMDELRDRVREPLTAWENAEKNRVAAHEAALASIAALAEIAADSSADAIAAHLARLQVPSERDWQEFVRRAADTRASTIARLTSMHAAAVKREAEAAELARLRAEEAERQRQEAIRQQAEREARIAAEAAEGARLEAERRATEEAATAERRAAEERERLEQQTREAEDRAQKAEANRIAAEQGAERERQEWAERERLAAEQAERDWRDAVEAERRRAAQEKAAEEEAERKRAADKAHRASVNRAALNAMLAVMSEAHSGTREEAEAIARSIVQSIARGAIPAITIHY